MSMRSPAVRLFERSVNPEGSETTYPLSYTLIMFERSVNPEGSETASGNITNATEFERSVNPEGSETFCLVLIDNSRLREV